MKFLFLITHYYPQVYGAEIFAQELAEYLTKKGHQVDIVTGQWQRSWPKTEKLNQVNIHRVKVLKIRFFQTILFIFPQLLKAKKLVKENQYDYIHAHIFPSLVTGALLKSKARKIVTIQGGDLADYNEIYGPFKFLLKPLISFSLKKYTKIHTVSSDLSEKVNKMTNKNSVIIPNGIKDSLLLLKSSQKILKQYSLPKTKHLIYSPSRLTEKNNLRNLIKSVDILRKQRIDIGLAIAGTGHLEHNLKNLVKTLNLAKYIYFLGYVPQNHNQQLIKKADTVARVSKKEGFGIALLEALALKTPVITSQKGGLKDFISEDNAYLPDPHSPKDIAKKIKKTLSNPKTKSGYNLVKSKYIYSKVLNKFTKNVYEF